MTLKTLTMARNGGLVIASAVLMGEPISGLEAFGYTGLLACFAMYTYVKAQEGTVPSRPSTQEESRGLCAPTPPVPDSHAMRCMGGQTSAPPSCLQGRGVFEH